MDINKKGLDEVRGRARDHARALSTWPCDQTDEKATIAAVDSIEKQLGPIEALVNTIGWVGTTRFEEEDSTYWRKVIAINLEAWLYVTHPVLKSMIARKHGKMVHFASDAGRVGTSGEVVYSATKGGNHRASPRASPARTRATTSTSTACRPALPRRAAEAGDHRQSGADQAHGTA